MSARRPLTARPLDLLYFAFFLIHIPATLLVDMQALYPPALVPSPLARLPAFYLQLSGDPLIAGAFGLNGPPALWVWFRSFLVLEAVFQLPVFCIALRGLWRDSRALYPLLLIYSASTATTTLACISMLLNTRLAPAPVVLDPFASSPSSSLFFPLTVTSGQRVLLLASFMPFLLVPLLMCVDMAVRVTGLIARGVEAQVREIDRDQEREKEEGKDRQRVGKLEEEERRREEESVRERERRELRGSG